MVSSNKLLVILNHGLVMLFLIYPLEFTNRELLWHSLTPDLYMREYSWALLCLTRRHFRSGQMSCSCHLQGVSPVQRHYFVSSEKEVMMKFPKVGCWGH